MGCFRSENARQLLHNKFVVVLGDSIQRSVYKDLVKFLQRDEFLSEDQLRDKGEIKFENDSLIEGGQLNVMTNETTFREVRQYRSGHHLVRFYFLTRVYSTYLESILSDFQSGPQPDVLIANSCVWDLNRYNDHHLKGYKTNLDHLFLRLTEVLSPQCLIIWNMTMPVGQRDHDVSFQITPPNLRKDIAEANFFSAILANFHHLDVLDMHYHFRHDLHLRCIDSVHWNQQAHRKYTQILLTHIARAWGVKMPKAKKSKGSSLLPAPSHHFSLENESLSMLYSQIQEQEHCSPSPPPFENDSPLFCANMNSSCSTLAPCKDPTGRDYGGIYRGSPLLPTPPRRTSLEHYPHPVMYPPIPERERCGPGSPLLPTPPRRTSLGNDPHPMPYPPNQERERCGPAPPLLGTGSPPRIPPDCFPLPPGLDETRPPFFPMMPALMEFSPREPWEINIRPRKVQNWRRIRRHPYHPPADHPYHEPADHLYHTPTDHPYHPPANHPYHTPANHLYHAPADQPYHIPDNHPYHAPADQPYYPPINHLYHGPADHQYHPPTDHPYHAPADHPPFDHPSYTPADHPPADHQYHAPADHWYHVPDHPPADHPFLLESNDLI